MNKKFGSSLSEADRQLLGVLDKQYKQAEEILGTEPSIYADFNISPESENTGAFAANERRLEVYNTLLKNISNNF